MRIPTGGALPDGADAVVPVEDAIEEDGAVTPVAEIAAGDCFTPAGSDLRAGALVLAAGRRIGGPELGVLATVGVTAVPVYRKPRFGVASTGDELVDPAQEPAVGQVRDSNRYAIAGALRAMGAEAVHFPRVPDDAESLRAALATMLAACDAIVFTGGSSVGARDLVPRVVAAYGEPGVIVHGIRLKPGKPTMLAAIGATPVLGLPGNPTSSLMVLEAVARPIVAACTGERGARPATYEAIAEEPFEGREGWTWFVPAQVRSSGGRLLARPLKIHSAWVSWPRARAALRRSASGPPASRPASPCASPVTPPAARRSRSRRAERSASSDRAGRSRPGDHAVRRARGTGAARGPRRTAAARRQRERLRSAARGAGGDARRAGADVVVRRSRVDRPAGSACP